MASLNQVSALFPGNNCCGEYTSYLNSCYRCLLDWTHYQTQRGQSALATASLRFENMRQGRSADHRSSSLVSTLGNLLTRSRDWSFHHLRTPLVSAIGNLFSRHNPNEEIAEESAQFCLAGLARLAATDAPNVEPEPNSAGAIFKAPDLETEPHLLSAGNPN